MKSIKIIIIIQLILNSAVLAQTSNGNCKPSMIQFNSEFFNQVLSNKIILSQTIDDEVKKALNLNDDKEKRYFLSIFLPQLNDTLKSIHYLYRSTNEHFCLINYDLLSRPIIVTDVVKNSGRSIFTSLSVWHEMILMNIWDYKNVYFDSTVFTIKNYHNTNLEYKKSGKGNHFFSTQIQPAIRNLSMLYIDAHTMFLKPSSDTLVMSFTMKHNRDKNNRYYIHDNVKLFWREDGISFRIYNEEHTITRVPRRLLDGPDWKYSDNIIYPQNLSLKDIGSVKIIDDIEKNINVTGYDVALVDTVGKIVLYSLWGRSIKGEPLSLSYIYKKFLEIPENIPVTELHVSIRQRALEAYTRAWNEINNTGKPQLYFEDIAPPESLLRNSMTK